MSPHKFIARLVKGGSRKSLSAKRGDGSCAHVDDPFSSPISATPRRSIAALAAAYAREKQDAEFVRRQLPSRIDELLLREIRCSFEHSLCEIVVRAATEAAQGTDAQASAVASKTLFGAAGCAAQALEGLEARLNARKSVASGENVVPLDDTARARLLKGFADQLSAGVAAAVPRILGMGTVRGAVALRDAASRQLPCMRESWESVLQCKTQITDVLLDNDDVALERKLRLLAEAFVHLGAEDRPLPALDEEDVEAVVEFLTEAVQLYPAGDAARRQITARLGSLLCPQEAEDTHELEQAWRIVAEKVLTAIAEAKLDTADAPPKCVFIKVGSDSEASEETSLDYDDQEYRSPWLVDSV